MFIHVYTTRDHNTKTGRSMSAINMAASFPKYMENASGLRLVPNGRTVEHRALRVINQIDAAVTINSREARLTRGSK
jgi:hypothetical protein